MSDAGAGDAQWRPRRPRRRPLLIGMAAALAVTVLAAGVVWATGAQAPTSRGSLPTAGTRESGEHAVFAHYFPPYPVSLDNGDPSTDYYARNYLSPWGEDGSFADVGGLLRDRPLPRAPLPGDWRMTDLTTEVNQAADAGIDGFTVDVLSLSGSNWTTTVDLIKAAAASGRDFHVAPNVDVSASAGQASPARLADKLARLFASPGAYRLPDGRYVLSSFEAEGKPVRWWTQMFDALKQRHDVSVAFVAVLLDASDANMRAFAPISWAESSWGQRTPVTIDLLPDYAAKAHKLGVKWMAPVAVQDERPRATLYAEAGNTETLRASWRRAIDDRADMVQLVTWNDYSEGTSFAPSSAHGQAYLDVSAYYASWFRTRIAPLVRRDEVILTHRIQFFSAVPEIGSTPMRPTLNGFLMPPRNTVEVLTMLTAPAEVQATIGGHAYSARVPAGLSTVTFPLALGTVQASVSRGGVTIVNAISQFPVVARPEVQDLQYYAAVAKQ
jgi:Glycosyl hydrolase family 71.